MQEAPETELAILRPNPRSFFRFGMYALAVFFYGLIPVALIIPFGPPAGHPAYPIAWVLGAAVALVVVHRRVARAMQSCHLTLTARTLTVGSNPPTTIRIGDVVDTIPILTRQKPFDKPSATVNPAQFTVVLLRLRDGSRLPLSGIYGVRGFPEFLVRLFSLLGPTIRTQAELSADDLAVLGVSRANKLHQPAHR